MIEIIGDNLEKAFAELGIKATKTYQAANPKYWQEVCQVWEFEESEFEKFCDMDESGWKEDWGWWRYEEGSNMFGCPTHQMKVNNTAIEAWYDEKELEDVIREYVEDYNHLMPHQAEERAIEEYFEKLGYSDLLMYFCDCLGVSQPRNVCALAVDLARINGMKMSELFQMYQG